MRMSRFACGLLVLVAVCTAQDKPKGSDAEQYAGELSKLLSEYQKQLSNKITAEQRAYEEAARLYDDAFRENVFASLSLDRTADAQQAQRALQARTLTSDKMMEDIYAYAQRDFDQTRAVYQMGIDSYKTYLSNLNSLQADSQKIGSLVKSLNDLAKPTSLKDRLKEVQAYQDSFNKQMHFSECSMADSLLTINTEKKTVVDAKIQSLTTQIAAGGADVAALQAAKSVLDQEGTSLKAQIAALTARRTNSGGFTPGTGAATGKCEVK